MTVVIGSSILIVTLLIQIYSVCRIAYCKWKYRSNEVIIFSIQDGTNGLALNNTSYNEILFDLAPMVFIGLAVIVCGSVRMVYSRMGLPENFRTVSPAFLYYYEFSEIFITQLGFPSLFYFFHPKARKYVANIIACK